MISDKELNKFLETQSNNMGHRDRVRKFCKKHPDWNPILGKWDFELNEHPPPGRIGALGDSFLKVNMSD